MTLLPKRVVRQFLNRELDDHRYLKLFTHSELDKEAAELPVKPPIWKGLDRHQKVGLLLAAWYEGRYALFYDTGMGKTFMSTAIVRYFRKLKKVHRALVLVPKRINKSEWRRQVDKHSPSTSLTTLDGSSERKWEWVAEGATMVVESYGGLTRMCCKLTKVRSKNGKKVKWVLKPDPARIRQLVKSFDALVMDESTHVQYGKGKLIFRICRQVAKRAECVLALSGTPFNDPEDLWGQMYLVDKGETLGKTLGLYRAAFFSEHEGYWGHISYHFKKSMHGKLTRTLAHRSLRYEVDESDLPPLIPRVKEVSLPADARVYLERAQGAIKQAHGNYREMKNAFVQMRQLSSGWLGYVDDELGTKAKYVFPRNPKLESLMATVDSVVDSYKAIIYHQYTFSADLICRELKDMGVGFLRLWGGTKNHDELLARFDDDRKARVLVMQLDMSFGPNLQAAKYGLFFELPVSPIVRKQAQRRFERQHSQHDKVFRYDYVVRGTYDQRILDALAEGKSLFDQIMDGRAVA
jgi:SNF2 family DNA or RNA helicase